MALHLAVYDELREVIVHRAECEVWTNTEAVFQVSPVVRVDEGWRVVRCSVCDPEFGVVTSRRWFVLDRADEMVASFQARESLKRRMRLADVDVPVDAGVREGWKGLAACRSDDERLHGWLSWLFLTESGRRWQTDTQKAICGGCEVRVDCLVSAVWGGEPWGVWGGATPQERQVLLKRWRQEGRVSPRERGRLDSRETMAV